MRFVQRDEDAFSLVELMVVVVIAGILVSVAVPTMIGARSRSQDSLAQTSLRTAGAAAAAARSEAGFVSSAPWLGSQEQALTFTSGASTGPKEISVGGSTAHVLMAVLSETGTCFSGTVSALGFKSQRHTGSCDASSVSAYDFVNGSTITTIAGTGVSGFSGDGGPALTAELSDNRAITTDSDGNIYIASWTHRVRKIDRTGIITTVAGTGVAGSSGDGGPATSAQLNTPAGLVVDSAGNLYISDSSNQRIRKVDTNGIITTIAGTGTANNTGDGGPATSATLYYPHGLVFDASGNLFVADMRNHRIRKIDSGGTITTVAGSGGNGASSSSTGDGGPATSATLNYPRCVAVSSTGVLTICDSNSGLVRRVDAGGTITTVTSTSYPRGASIDPSDNVYIADSVDCVVRRITPVNAVSTVAGTGTCGYSGDNGPPLSAQIGPAGVSVDRNGNLVLSESGNNRVRIASM